MDKRIGYMDAYYRCPICGKEYHYNFYEDLDAIEQWFNLMDHIKEEHKDYWEEHFESIIPVTNWSSTTSTDTTPIDTTTLITEEQSFDDILLKIYNAIIEIKRELDRIYRLLETK